MENLRSLLEDQIKDIASAESQVSKALPKLAKAAHDPKLAKAFEDHLEETLGQVKRLEKIGSLLDMSIRGEKCEAAEGLIAEGEEIIENHEMGPTRDAGLIAAAQRFEHYEMAAYGTAREFAHQLGLKEVAKLLQETLDEEGEANKLLNKIAMGGVNERAMKADANRAVTAAELEQMTKDELYKLAQERDLDGRSEMSKKELLRKLL